MFAFIFAFKRPLSLIDAHLALSETYHMIDTCDPDIATWSKDGLAFVVKEPEKFAAEIIGRFLFLCFPGYLLPLRYQIISPFSS